MWYMTVVRDARLQQSIGFLPYEFLLLYQRIMTYVDQVLAWSKCFISVLRYSCTWVLVFDDQMSRFPHPRREIVLSIPHQHSLIQHSS